MSEDQKEITTSQTSEPVVAEKPAIASSPSVTKKEPRTGGFGDRSGQRRRPGGFGQRGDRPARPGGRPGFGGRKPADGGRKKFDDKDSGIESLVIEVRRVSKTVKGGKKMRFAALVIAGNREGMIGFGNAKGLDFQDAVAKATRKAKDRMHTIKLNEDASISFPVNYKFKSSQIYLKPARSGTGLIAGGFLRSVLQLAGVQNVYSKVFGSNNKVVGVRAAVQALANTYAK